MLYAGDDRLILDDMCRGAVNTCTAAHATQGFDVDARNATDNEWSPWRALKRLAGSMKEKGTQVKPLF